MTKQRARERWECPARDCRVGTHDRQKPLNPALRERIPPRDRRATEESPAGAIRCGACGCVYLHDSRLDTGAGFLDGGMLGGGWHPAQRRSRRGQQTVDLPAA